MAGTETKSRTLLYSSLIGVLLITLFTLALVIDFSRMRTVPPAEPSTDSPVEWSLDTVDEGNYFLTFSGWALIPGEPPATFDCALVLLDSVSGKYLRLPTQMTQREELSDRYADGIDYTLNGFYAKAFKPGLALEHHSYRVFIDYRNNAHHYFIDTALLIGGNQ